MGAQTASLPAMQGDRVRRVLLIVNRKAGTVLRRPELPEALRRCVGARGDVVAPVDQPELLRALSRARAQAVDTIAICGGDGTNHVIASAIHAVYGNAHWPRLILLPGGTLNTVGQNFGCQGPAPRLLADILASEEPQVVRRPLLRVNEHTGFIFGSQMVARVLDFYYAHGASVTGAVALTARIVFSAAFGTTFSRHLFRQDAARVELDGDPPVAGRFTCLMASTISTPSIGIRAMPRAGEDGGFHLIATEAHPTRLFREAGRVFSGLPLDALILSQVGHRATLTYESECRYTIDGDLFSAREITLGVTPPAEILLPPDL